MTRMLKTVPAFIAAAGLMVSAMGEILPQETYDYVDETVAGAPRLVINGKKVWISGINIAWREFAKDVGDQSVQNDKITSSQLDTYRQWFEQIGAAGGNAVRWWLHTDASQSPLMNDETGEVTGISDATIYNMKAVLDLAYEYGIVVSMCLFSFDLMDGEYYSEDAKGNKTKVQVDRNRKFLTEPDNLDSYIRNALIPILEAVGDHPAIMCWEVFNEPEGMTKNATSGQKGWAGEAWIGDTKVRTSDNYLIEHSHVMRFTARIAAVVHDKTKKMASTGIHNFHDYKSAYTVENLNAAAGDDPLKDKAYLDFYMAHHYPQYESKDKSPFYNIADSWGYDKPVLIGEFPAQSWGNGSWGQGYPYTLDGPLDIKDAYNYAYNNGYLGAMSWSITEGKPQIFGNLATTLPALKYMAETYDDIRIRDDITIEELEGDLAMKVSFDALAIGDANEVLLEKPASFNLASSHTVTFDMYIDAASGSSLQMAVAIQGTSWGWDAAPVNVSSLDKGQWVPVSVSIPIVDNVGVSNAAMVLFKFTASGSPYTGTVYIDNIKVDNTLLSDFDDDKYSAWNVKTGDVSVSIVKHQELYTSIRYAAKSAKPASRAPVATVRGKTLNVVGADNSDMAIRLINVNGKTVARFKAQGRGQFSLAKVPAGRYIVETRVAGKRVGSSAVIVK